MAEIHFFNIPSFCFRRADRVQQGSKERAPKELTAALRMDPKFTGADKAKAALEALK